MYPQAQSSQPTNYWSEMPTVQPNLDASEFGLCRQSAIYGVMPHVHISNTPITNVIVELDGLLQASK